MAKINTLLILLFSINFLFSAERLVIYCGAGLMTPMEEIKEKFLEDNDLDLKISYAGSGQNFGKMKLYKKCDVFISGSTQFTNLGINAGLIEESSVKKIVKHIPVILVSSETDFEINSLKDLNQNGLKLAIGDKQSCAIGKVAERLLKRNKLFKDLEDNIVVRTPTINQLFVYIKLNEADAAILTENWAFHEKDIDYIHIPKEENDIMAIPAAITTFSERKERAADFTNFLISPAAYKIWNKWGFFKWEN